MSGTPLVFFFLSSCVRPRRPPTSGPGSTAPRRRSTSGTSWTSTAARRRAVVALEGEGAAELPRTPEHLALRAFALVAPLEGHRFRFVNRIPLERGLGSQRRDDRRRPRRGAAVAGRTLSPDELLELGLPLEGHADNLAAALSGGVCLSGGTAPARTPRGSPRPAARADRRRPGLRVNTKDSRSRLPETRHPRGGGRRRRAGGPARRRYRLR